MNNPPVSAKQLRTIAAVGGQEHDHGGFDDLDDTSYGGRRSYSEEVEEINEMDKEMPLSREQLDNIAKEKPAKYAKLYDKVSPEMRKKLKLKLPAKLPEEVEQIEEAPQDDDRYYKKCQECKKGKYVEKDIYGAHLKCTNCGDVVNRYERDDHPKEPGPSIPEVIAKNNEYEKALAALKKKHGISEEIKFDEEMNNRITKIHVRGQNVIVHKWDATAGGTYKEVKHHSSATAAQTYARQLHRARGGDAKLVIEGIEQINERKYDFAARIKRRLLPGAARQQATRRAADLGDQVKTHANLGRGVGSTTSPKDATLARIKAKAAGKYRKIAAVDEAVKKVPVRRMGSVARYSTANKKWQFVRDPMVKTITGMSEGMLSNIVARLTKKKPVDLKAAAKQRRADAIKYTGTSPKQTYQGLPSDMTQPSSHTRSERDANIALGAKK